MPTTDDTRERLVAVEVKLAHVIEKVDDSNEKIDRLYDAYTQAKGARWPFIIFAALATFMGTVGGAIAKWIPAISALAR